MATAEDLNKRLQGQIDYIAEAINNIKQDNLMDMKPMDTEVASICEEIENADKDVAASTEPKMMEMIGLLDQLATELDAFKERRAAQNDK